MKPPPIVSPHEWETARQQLLVEEKKLTRARDAMAAKRRRMLVDGGRQGLLVRRSVRAHEPRRLVRGPPPADRLPRLLRTGRHDLPRERRLVPAAGVRRVLPRSRPGGASRPPERTEPPRWCTSSAHRRPRSRVSRNAWDGSSSPGTRSPTTSDTDFGVAQWHGTNAFIRDGDRIFRTYFVQDRGDEQLGSTWSYLDITALGRQEDSEGLTRGLPADHPRTSGGTTTTPTEPPSNPTLASMNSTLKSSRMCMWR